MIDGRRHDAGERLGDAAERLVEAAEQLGSKRAANGARGLSMSAPMRLKPSRRSVVRVSRERPQRLSGKRRKRLGFAAPTAAR